MSLTSFLDLADVKAKLKPLLPKCPRKIGVPLKVEARSKRYSMVGTAFDYLLRFEFQRKAPHAIIHPWIAECVPDSIWQPGLFMHVSKDASGIVSFSKDPHADEGVAKDVSNRMRNIVNQAKSAVAEYLQNKSPGPALLANLATHAIRLAKLDPIFRAGVLDPTFETANPEDVEDLVTLLAIVPFDLLLHEKVLILNPNFEETSELVGGADADLLTGDMLVDFKTTKAGEMTAVDLNQLLGYYLLARHQRRGNSSFPVVNRLALYFCRHGHLWTLETSVWTEHPQFAEIEEWFFTRAQATFGRGKTR